MNWGDLPTWLAGVGTIGAFVVAFAQIARERNARLHRDAEQVAERRRAQADGLSVWTAGEDEEHEGQSWLEFSNVSNQPVYWVVVSPVAVYGAAPNHGQDVPEEWRSFVSILPPGRSFVQAPRMGGGMHVHFGFEIAFTDHAGLHWLREKTGSLHEIDQWSIGYYKNSQPVSWLVPTTARPASAV